MRCRKLFCFPCLQGQVTNVLKITKSGSGKWVDIQQAPSLRSSTNHKPVLGQLQLDLVCSWNRTLTWNATWCLHQTDQSGHSHLPIRSWQTAQQHLGWQGFLWLCPDQTAVWMNWSECFKECWQLCSCFARVNVQTYTVLMTGLWSTHSLRTLASLCKLSTHKTRCFTRFRILTLLFLKIHILRDKMLHHWASGFWYFEEPQCLQLRDHTSQDLTALHTKGRTSFKTPETTHPSARHRNPQHLNTPTVLVTSSRKTACMKRSVVLLHRQHHLLQLQYSHK